MVKIFIDPGHGGHDPGATANGLREKDINLKIALKMKSLLSGYEGVQVKLSRETDKFVSLSQRAKMANEWGADYFVSIHVNAGGGTGFESYIYNGKYSGKQETHRKRSIIHAEVMRQLADVRDRGMKEANFQVLRETKMAAILTENLFVDHKDDAAKLKQDSWLQKIAQGHVNGVAIAFGLKKKQQPKPQPKQTTGKLYRVQIGAFSKRENAEKLLKEAKAKGFKDAFIKYE